MATGDLGETLTIVLEGRIVGGEFCETLGRRIRRRGCIYAAPGGRRDASFRM
jgi:hypothetical protein